MNENNLELVREILAILQKNNIQVILGGGWAEEFQGLIKPREHKDIDLYFIAEDFQKVDSLIKVKGLHEVQEKHFNHKRAFINNKILIEIVLIQKDQNGYYSNFWNKRKIRWPKDLAVSKNSIEILSPKALKFYRDSHDLLFPTDKNTLLEPKT